MPKSIVRIIFAAVLTGAFVLPAARVAGAEWYDHISWSGDLRYRHENIQDSQVDLVTGDVVSRPQRDRQRIRLRFGLQAKVNDVLDTEVRLATSPGEINSRNQTLTGSFDNKGIGLDLAQFTLSPLGDVLSLTGGKIKNPFVTLGKAPLIYDGDITPEGMAVAAEIPAADMLTVFGTLGGFWIDEVSNSVDKMLYALQAGVVIAIDSLKVKVGGGYHEFTLTDVLMDEFFLEAGTQLGDLPVKVYGSYVMNGDKSRDNTGYLAGVGVGKAGKQGTWQASVDYRALAAEAGSMGDSDFANALPDSDGVIASAEYALWDNFTVGLTYIASRYAVSTPDPLPYNRLQADLVMKFK